jgi:hypothetical protein
VVKERSLFGKMFEADRICGNLRDPRDLHVDHDAVEIVDSIFQPPSI